MANLLLDIRADHLSETVILDSVTLLKKRHEERLLDEFKKGGMDTEKRQEILRILREQKPDTNKRQQNDDDPFA